MLAEHYAFCSRRWGGSGLAAQFIVISALGFTRMRPYHRTPMALLDLDTQVASPLENGISRRIETQADVDALKATEDPVALSEMQMMLAWRSLADPTPPVRSQWRWGSHPTVLQRLALVGA